MFLIKSKNGLIKKRLNEQKEEGEQMSVLRELYDNRDRNLEHYDRMVEEMSKAEQQISMAKQTLNLSEQKK
ncbi:hypothetical protein BM735_12055 [Erysipelotrichaceae bacterium NYU-BL-F16]|nr:hypothetical protein BM735_12055 [Erysipelotrichaceae bacterium NYU-BL-F16]